MAVLAVRGATGSCAIALRDDGAGMPDRSVDGVRRKDQVVSDPGDWNRQIVEEFRANAGKVGGPFDGRAFNVTVVHRVGFDNEIVAQLGIGA